MPSEQPRPSQSPWWSHHVPSVKEVVTHVMGLGILVFTGVVLFPHLGTGNVDGFRNAQSILAMLGPIVGGVLGYYFGSSSGERVAREATATAEQALESKERNKALSERTLGTSKLGIDESRQLLQTVLDRLEAHEKGSSIGTEEPNVS